MLEFLWAGGPRSSSGHSASLQFCAVWVSVSCLLLAYGAIAATRTREQAADAGFTRGGDHEGVLCAFWLHPISAM